jgi:methylamine--corrinoid protein Co-methyltransferase
MAASKPVTVFETYDRFLKGKKVREDTWDYVTVPNNAAMIKNRYKLEFGKNIIPEDKGTMNNLFAAGVDMLVETGFFNPDMGRVMYVTESEVFEGIKKVSKRLRLGSGKDEVICERRRGNVPERPIIQGGPTGAPVSEDIFVTMMQGYAQEAAVDTLVSGVLSSIDGHAPTANTPWEIKATLAEIRAVREGMARAERPGMAI